LILQYEFMPLKMKVNYCFILFCLIISSTFSANSQNIKKPNIIFILTDDLGYGDIGVFFQNERKKNNLRHEPYTLTPNLDKMGAEGAVLTNHYAAAPVCAPSRGSLLSGLSQGHANVRDNQFDKALADNYTLGNVLQKAGYATAAIGKWGLQGVEPGLKPEDEKKAWVAHPLDRGFDYYYGYMRHRDGHEHYPVEAVYGTPKEVYENRKEVSEGLDKCYTGDLFTARAKEWIIEQTQSKKDQKPFFVYLAYDTPHAVLELPTQAYPKGGGLNGGMQWLGKPGNMISTASGKVDSWIHPDYVNATYDQDQNPVTKEIPWPDVYKRYATVVRRIDDQIGDILKLLKDLKIDDNTLVVFSSDNGASNESYLKEPFKANFFSSFGYFDGIKRDVLEGGSRVPTIVNWPKHVPANTIINTPSISYDWLPTFTEMAGLPAPVNGNGVSILPSITQKGKQTESLIYMEYFMNGKTPNYKQFSESNRGRQRNQMQMLRLGNMIGVRYDIQNADADFEIYNIGKDTHQANNLAKSSNMEALQSTFKERVLQNRIANSTAPRPYDNEGIPAVHIANFKKGVSLSVYKNNYLWVPQVSGLEPVKKEVVQSIDINKGEINANCIKVYKAYVKVPADGEYTFYLNSSNKAFVKLHGINLIDADFDYKPGMQRATKVNLKAGFHPIEVYYFNDLNGGKQLMLEWESASFARSKIADPSFFIEQ
jgi:arylsulfatase A-like enzyme